MNSYERIKLIFLFYLVLNSKYNKKYTILLPEQNLVQFNPTDILLIQTDKNKKRLTFYKKKWKKSRILRVKLKSVFFFFVCICVVLIILLIMQKKKKLPSNNSIQSKKKLTVITSTITTIKSYNHIFTFP